MGLAMEIYPLTKLRFAASIDGVALFDLKW